ncbi:hypothetical protein HN51_027699 [Arachis hypogaea]|uniref:Phospholipid/glycerol acyltransferase domain-containing protein n=1 Tax=Arachis hypogaea TaxID=3818 RepID=A0A445BLV9_ARAHY|nr:probable glycerol-3-phosphate acyltransferase 3 [Arachis hypogaea]QHO34118.1 putative glycerol-3-phosphate acyltransferase [Arachis hypogaea]RYR39657.1 hypothetical protein Ahy_A09g045231 [Arachis hypogaea]
MAKMFRAFFFKSLFFFWYRFLFRQLKSLIGLRRNILSTQFKYQKFSSFLHQHHRSSELGDHTLVFDVENALLKSSSLFPYFMLVAFEAGGLIRAIVLVLLYPVACAPDIVGQELGLKMMVMICFFGIKVDSFRVGRSVLPKFLLEDVGKEMFDVLKRSSGKKVGVTNMPRIMVESFLREYLEIDVVVGRELKVFCGYFVGLMEEKKSALHALEQVQEGKGCSDMIGITRFNKVVDHQLFSHCKEVYAVSEAEKRSWQRLSKDKYPKPLIFHDGRLALRPTLFDSIAILMWLPYALILAIIRISLALSLPYNFSTPLLVFTGIHLTTSEIPKMPPNNNNKTGTLYVCNHRTLLDPLYISFTLQRNLIAVTYSLSRMSEILAPIKTVRLTRNRDQDANMMKHLLAQGDLVVCPEGTTCREPYLLRFSPLFSEMCDDIAPVAVNSHVTMFHGTTAGGLKCLDPVFFLMNPSPVYTVDLLQHVQRSRCVDRAVVTEKEHQARFKVANHVQSQIGSALGFECTKLTRKDKYLILAGNEGVVINRACGKS